MKDWELSYRNNGRYLKNYQKKKKKEKNKSKSATLSFEEWSQKKKEAAAAKPTFDEWSSTKKKFADAFAPIAVKGAYAKNEADDVNVGMADGDYIESKETDGKSKTTVTRTGKKETTTTENKVTHRDANLIDITLRSLKRGYDNARYGEESYAAMVGQNNKKAEYEEILNGDEYKFVPSNKLEEGVAGAFELLGQQVRQSTNPTSVAAGTAAAGVAFTAGQFGPQVLAPEEVITVPGAFFAGLATGSAASNYKIEAGLAYNEMIEAGISKDTAMGIAAAVGTVNASLEAFQIDELFDAYRVVSKGATKGVAKKIAKELANRGISVAKETTQEVAQEGVTIAGTQVASKIENGDWAYSADEVTDRLGDTAKSAALSFGIMNTPAAVRNSVSYATEQKNTKKLTSNEEKVVEKEVENRVAEEETNGKKLSNKMKSKIYDAVLKDLEKGNISTDVIEEVLGGETYTSYREVVDREDALQKEFDTLNKMKQGNMTGEQVDRREELRQQLKDIQGSAQRDQLKTRLAEEVSEMVKGERLSESYNEKARRSQAFVADVTQYDAKQQETVQKAIDSGVLNNTNRTHEFVDMIAKISADKGVSFDFTDNAKLKETGFALEEKTVNGYVTDSGITININSAKAFNSVVGHEITHVLEGTEFYDTLQQTLFEYAKRKGDYQSGLDALTVLYKDVEGTDINAELTADLVGDYLFTDTDFVMKLSTEHRNIFQKIFDEIKYLCKVATAGSKEARQLEKVRKVFEEAYRESGKAQKNTATEGGVRYALSNQNGYDYSQSFEQQIDDYKAGKIPSRDTLLVGATPEVYQSIGLNALPMTINTTHVDYALNGTKDADHYLGEAVLKQLPESIKDPVAVFVSRTKSGSSVVALLNFNVNGKRVVAPVEIDGFGFQNGIRIDSNAVTSIYGKNSALKQLYQAAQNESNGIFCLLYANKKEAYSLLQSAGYQLSGGLIPHDGFYHSIRENNSPVKPKFNNVAESQQFKRWFGDWQKHPKNASKVVDSDGNPLVVYHGTDAEFTEFNTDNQRTNSKLNFGKGIYLTPNKNLAEMYTTTGNVMELYASVKNPYEIFSTRLDESDLQKLSVEFGENVTLENIDAVLQKNKFDGIIARNYNGTTNPINQIVVFNSNQVKSATDNIGTFDGNNPDIRYSLSSGNENTAPVKGGIYGKDILLAPVGENVVRTQTTSPDNLAPVGENVERAGVASAEEQNVSIKGRNKAKLRAYEAERSANAELQKEAVESYNEQIADLQAEYDSKKNKNTKVANGLLQRIERLKRLRDDVSAKYGNRISDLNAKISKMKSKAFKTAEQRMTKQQEYLEQMKELIGDTTTWVDKKLGLSYKVNTLRRNLRDVVRNADGKRDIEKADAIYDELQGKYNHNEALLNREATQIKQAYAKEKITRAEDAYIQMLGEFLYNPDTTLIGDEVKEFYDAHKSTINLDKVKRVIHNARQTYDDLLVRVNEVLKEQGMKEIPYRQGYFPHFTQEKQGFLAKLFNWKTNNNEIPTDIAGLTENFNPERSWQSFNKHRKSDITDYSFTKGLDTYVQGALDWIYHIEDIQKRRAFENYIRYVHSEEGVKKRIEDIQSNEEYDADEMQEQIDLVYKEAGNPLNNFVTDFRAATNNLANKKSSLDRGVEEMTNRKFYSVITNLSNRVNANMVGGSISSALTNFIPITQSWGQVSPISSLKAMGATIRSAFRDDGTVDKSDFLTNRLKKAENLHKTTWDKVKDKAGLLMEGVDSFTSQTVWRSKYLENISKGMSENEAIKNADQFAENVLGGRSRGNDPTIFHSKNPIVKTLTAFQLEVNNQYGYMFKDMPQDMRSESIGKLVKGYATMFIGAYVYNALYSSLIGRDAAFDPIGIIEELLRDLGLFGDDEEEEDPADIILDFTDNILEEVPFVGGLVGGGRIPISSALPYGEGVYETLSGMITDMSNGDWENLTREWLNPLYYLALPIGGGQIRKTVEGLGMFNTDMELNGSYTSGDKLRFKVEDTLLNRLQAAVFGQYASKTARKYFDEGRTPLGPSRIQELNDVDISMEEYWDYLDGLKDLETLSEKGDYIAGLDLPVEKKNILINNIVDRKEQIDLTDYDKYPNFEEFDFGTKNPGRYALAQSVGGYTSYKVYSKELNAIKSDKDENGETISGSRKDKVIEYINNLDADYGEKIILFRSQYTGDDTYNYEIIDYLNSRDDISYEEMETILKELGFTVLSDGTVKW